MKKTVLVVLALAAATTFAACGKKTPPAPPPPPPVVPEAPPPKETSRTRFTCSVGFPPRIVRAAPLPVTVPAWHTEHSNRLPTTWGAWVFGVAGVVA